MYGGAGQCHVICCHNPGRCLPPLLRSVTPCPWLSILWPLVMCRQAVARVVTHSSLQENILRKLFPQLFARIAAVMATPVGTTEEEVCTVTSHAWFLC